MSVEHMSDACAMITELGPDMVPASEPAPVVGTKRPRARSRSSSCSSSSSSSSSSTSSTSSNASKQVNRPAPGDRIAASDVKKTLQRNNTGTTTSDSHSASHHSDDEGNASELSGEEEVDQDEQERNDEPGIMRDLIVQLPKTPLDPTYKADWAPAPKVGAAGFNEFAEGLMRTHAVGEASQPAKTSPGAGSICPPLQPHQKAVAFLLHPQSPVSRLLVDHPTGSGKTREMIAVLDNYFSDPRPKVPIFPKEPVCRNFYTELLRWPSKYRDFFACLRPEEAARASGCAEFRTMKDHVWTNMSKLSDGEVRELINSIREVLEMKGWFFMGKMRKSMIQDFKQRYPKELLPAAPLRALRYTSAGGMHTELRNGMPRSALLKVAFDFESGNVYSNKIVVMDEAHNLLRMQSQYGAQLERLRDILFEARGLVLAGFTGTPILNEPWEGRRLLDIMKGRFHKGANDEGFLSSFPMRPEGLFPRCLPVGVPDAILTPKLRQRFVTKVPLHGDALKRYAVKLQKGLEGPQLQRYCNLSVHFGSFHDGKYGTKARILGDMANCAPKLHAIAKAVAACPLKALVLVAKNAGLDALVEYLRSLSENSEAKFGVATMEELSAFNAVENLRGQRYRVLVADSSQCSEGVSFFAVRQVHLAEIPAAPSAFVQAVGRAIRMYGHKGLDPEEHEVSVSLYAATFPRWMKSPLGVWALRAQRKHQNAGDIISRAKALLRRLFRAEIRDVATLRQRITACAAQNGRGAGPLGLAEAAAFLEQLGLANEAKTLRERAAKKPRVRHTPMLRAPSASLLQPSVSLTNRPAPAAKKAEGDDMTLRQLVATPPKRSRLLGKTPSAPDTPAVHKSEDKKKAGRSVRDVAKNPHTPGGPLVVAICEVHSFATTEDAVERLPLLPKTADEQALSKLAQLTREYVPALAKLRSCAVDRGVLQQCAGASAEQDACDSDGESVVSEFGVSDGHVSEKEDVKPKKKSDELVLPAGWQISRTTIGKTVRKEYLGPQGQRFNSAADAEKSIRRARALQNMSMSKALARFRHLSSQSVESNLDTPSSTAPSA